jgi:protease PrsW
VRLGDRAAARRYAGRVAGPQAVKALRAYQQASTEMAFMHDRVLRGTAPPDGIQRVHAHLRRMQSWRPYVVLPPVSWSAPIGPMGPPTVPGGALQGGGDRG